MTIFLGLLCFFMIIGIFVSLIATIVYIGMGIWNQDPKKGAMGIKLLVLTIVLFFVFINLLLNTFIAILHSLKS